PTRPSLLDRSRFLPLPWLGVGSRAREGNLRATAMAKLYVHTVPPADLNKNTEWFMYPGVWTTYILILFFSWLLVLSVFGCTAGMAWTVVNLFHFAVGGLSFPSSPPQRFDLPRFFPAVGSRAARAEAVGLESGSIDMGSN
ncbi:hypothetical protein BHM03_00050886, partial [Ensete ventricosum]